MAADVPGRVPTAAITRERFGEWAETLAEQDATPVLCVAVGHDGHQGAIHICVPADPPGEELLTTQTIVAFLQAAIAQLKSDAYDVDDVNARRGRHRPRRYWGI